MTTNTDCPSGQPPRRPSSIAYWAYIVCSTLGVWSTSRDTSGHTQRRSPLPAPGTGAGRLLGVGEFRVPPPHCVVSSSAPLVLICSVWVPCSPLFLPPPFLFSTFFLAPQHFNLAIGRLASSCACLCALLCSTFTALSCFFFFQSYALHPHACVAYYVPNHPRGVPLSLSLSLLPP